MLRASLLLLLMVPPSRSKAQEALTESRHKALEEYRTPAATVIRPRR